MSRYDQHEYISQEMGFFLGQRGVPFKIFITKLFSSFKLKKSLIEMLTTDESMDLFASAFTSDLVDPENNYQVYEQLGDLIGNKFIVCYMYRRFPQLKCSDGVKVVARLRINYGAKNSFSKIASDLGFWKWISCTRDNRRRNMKSLLEDVFEAFLGVIEEIVDRKRTVGSGYAVAFGVLTKIFNRKQISLAYDDLYDAKTRLKELFDMHESHLGPLSYVDTKNRDGKAISEVFRVDGVRYATRNNGMPNKKKILEGKRIIMGTGYGSTKSDAQQNAADMALDTLAYSGWKKDPPAVYQRFNKNKKAIIAFSTVQKIKNNWKGIEEKEFDVNEHRSTRKKNRMYKGPVITYYLRRRDALGVKSCMDMGAKLDNLDTDGIYPIDALLLLRRQNVIDEMLNVLISNGVKTFPITKASKLSHVSDEFHNLFVVP
jgi:dsRNA-specific ribonuclease